MSVTSTLTIDGAGTAYFSTPSDTTQIWEP